MYMTNCHNIPSKLILHQSCYLRLFSFAVLAATMLYNTKSLLMSLVSLKHSRSSKGVEELFTDDQKLVDQCVKTRSWNSQPQSLLEAPNVRRTASSATIISRLLPRLAMERCSGSSLCSCCNTCMPTPHSRHPLSKHNLAPYLPSISIVLLGPAEAVSGDAQIWTKIFADTPISLIDVVKGPTIPLGVLPSADIGSTFDLLEALRLVPMDGEKTPTQESKRLPVSPGEDWSANVDQLIRETDAAFKAVGFALADAKQATNLTASWYTEEGACHPMVVPGRATLCRPHKQALVQNASISKNVKRNSRFASGGSRSPRLTAAGLRPRIKLNDTCSRQSSSPRLASIDVDAEGKLILEHIPLKRFQVEMEKVDVNNFAFEAINTASVNAGSRLEKDTSMTAKSSRLEDLTVHLDAARLYTDSQRSSTQATTFTEPSPPPEHVLKFPSNWRNHSQLLVDLGADSSEDLSNVAVEASIEHRSLFEVQGHNFPSPPTLSPPRKAHRSTGQRSRSGATRRVTSELPTIDEISLLIPSPPSTPPRAVMAASFDTPRHQKRGSPTESPVTPKAGRPVANQHSLRAAKRLPKLDTSIFLYPVSSVELPSTLYTLTSPLFQHGSIRHIQRPSNPHINSRSTVPLSTDPPMELSSSAHFNSLNTYGSNEVGNRPFLQSAISGGLVSVLHANDGLQLSDFPEIDIEELLEWWDGHGIEVGKMVVEAEDDDVARRLQCVEALNAGINVVEPKVPENSVLVDGEEVVRQWKQKHLNRDTHESESATKGHTKQDSGVLSKSNWATHSVLPAALKVGYIATPLREAAYRRANWKRETLEEKSETTGTELVAGYSGGEEAWYDFGNEKEESSDSSGPPSPMMDFKANSGSSIVPMGSNLNHDIGDFLRWENDNVERRAEG